jgi:hypothetical protein
MKRFLFILIATLSLAINSPVAFAQHHAKHVKKQYKKEAVVYVTRTGSKYHTADCSYLRYSSSPMNKREAIAAGYTACSRCNP